MTREAFEAALDSGQLETCMKHGRGVDKWYLCRRNGQTRTWKRDSSRFQIPIAFRFRDRMKVQDTHFNSGQVDQWFRIRPVTES